jgi:hypothetical protein
MGGAAGGMGSVAVRLVDSTPQALSSTSNAGHNAHTIFVAILFMGSRSRGMRDQVAVV